HPFPSRLSAPSHGDETASPLFFDGFLENIGLQSLLGIHFLESPVLVFEFFQSGHHGGIHATEFGAPLVKGSTAHTMLSTQLRHRYAVLGLFEDRQDLAVGKT